MLALQKRMMEISVQPQTMYRVGDVIVHKKYGEGWPGAFCNFLIVGLVCSAVCRLSESRALWLRGSADFVDFVEVLNMLVASKAAYILGVLV